MRISSRDVRIAARSLLRHRGFAAVAVLSLALAISLNTAMYSVIDALVSPKLDMRAPDRLYWLTIWGDMRGTVDNATRASLLQSGFHTYEGVSYYSGGYGQYAAVEHGRSFAQVRRAVVAPNYFALLGVHPLAGRIFADDDATSGAQPVLLSEQLAGTLFPDGASPIGASIDVDGTKHPVIGVLSRGASLPGRDDAMWMLPPPNVNLRALPINVVRLRDGASLVEADHELTVLSTRLALLSGESPKYTRFQLSSATTPQFHFKNFHYALIAAVVAVLLIACANLANLQLARGIGRSRELALRAALGASRSDIIAQLVIESVMLAGVGLILGLLLTFWGTHLIASRIPPSVAEFIIAPQTSWRVLVFAVVACVVCVILVGLFPAIRVSRVDPNELLKSGAGTGAHKRNRRQYGAMIAVQMGLSLALLSGAAIVVRAAIYYRQLRVGYDIKPLATAWLYFRSDTPRVVRYVDLQHDLIARARAMRETEDASVTFSGSVRNGAITIASAGGTTRQIPAPLYGYSIVSPSHLRTYRIPVVQGRDFTDGVANESELIIDQATARFLWPGGDPIGRLIKLGDDTSTAPWIRVVGVAQSMQTIEWSWGGPPRERIASRLGAIYYRPSDRDSVRVGKQGLVFDVDVRSASDPERLPISLRRHFVASPPYRLLSTRSMEERLGLLRERQRHNFVGTTFLIFALLALGLAALGIYGVIAHSVAERRREFGVRLALGASARDILRAVLREGNAIALGGIALGLLCTQQTAGWLRAFSFDEDRYDAPLFAAMAAVLFAVAVLSALWPALRATRIDPVESLRSE